MFRDMRRKRQLLPMEECVAILEKMTSGVLALNDDSGYPYAVPLSYVYADHKLYFHSALKGHKIELLEKNQRVSFCVIEQDLVVPEEFTTYFRSVIAFGQARFLTDETEKRAALHRLGEKYSPGDREALAAEIEKGFQHLVMIEMTIDRLTGKEAIELVRAKQAR